MVHRSKLGLIKEKRSKQRWNKNHKKQLKISRCRSFSKMFLEHIKSMKDVQYAQDILDHAEDKENV